MLFNSLEFILFFLPTVTVLYWWLVKHVSSEVAIGWLILASLCFYGWWKLDYLAIILGSVLINFLVGRQLCLGGSVTVRKVFLVFGIAANLSLLGYFKYYDFFAENINLLLDTDIQFLRIALPLGISFFTFQQIAYLVDAYRGICNEYNFRHYALFVTFFPQLIAGPIVHHKEMLPQFEDQTKHRVNYDNVAKGLLLFALGLCKKVLIADEFAQWANQGFDHSSTLTFLEAWAASLSYSLQLYFDFSAYCDMAMGAALLFNIHLPINFNSPYKSVNIQDFWRRWHMTLGRFIKDYIYIPLGGNQGSLVQASLVILMTFFLCGLWHGAGWGFVLWGLLHAAALVIYRLWRRFNINLPNILAITLTFLFVNFSWVFFRATSWDDTLKVLRGMFGMSGIALPAGWANALNLDVNGVQLVHRFANLPDLSMTTLYFLLVFLSVAFLAPNSIEISNQVRYTRKLAIATSFVSLWALFSVNQAQEFIYFNF